MPHIFGKKFEGFRKRLGPGIITGAADDDPSGILTYLIAGASTGFSLLWTALFTIPLMSAVQEMCARIGLATKKGLAGNMRKHFSHLILYPVALLVFIANTFNIAADLAGITSALNLLIPLPIFVLGLSISILIGVALVFFSYQKLALIFRWLTLPLLAYIGAALLSGLDLKTLFLHTFLPKVTLDKNVLIALTAILGTTISPYLFFWHASEEVEETVKKDVSLNKEVKNMRLDVLVGMTLSNLVMYFIIATGASIFKGETLNTIGQAANSLTPLAGSFSTLLFVLGILGTGILTIPILAGSAAYVVSETFGWHQGLDKSLRKAPGFYLTILISLIIGFLVSVLPFNPLDLLFNTAVLYGLLSPLLILLILILANNKQVMGHQVNGWVSNLLNTITLLLMTGSALSLFLLR